MTSREAERLMQYLDGELPPDESRDVERWISESGEARALLRDLEEVGEAVRGIALDHVSGLPDVTSSVMQRIARDGAATVSPGASSNVTRFGRYWAPAAALALAAAAAFVLYLHPARVVAPRSSVSARPAQAAKAPETAASLAVVEEPASPSEEEGGAEIESVDFGAQTGSIFMVASGPQVTPVVWLVDETAGSKDRMKPL